MKETIYIVQSFLTTKSGRYAECIEKDSTTGIVTLIDNKGYNIGDIIKVSWDGIKMHHTKF